MLTRKKEIGGLEDANAARYQSGEDQTSEAINELKAAKYQELIEILLSAGYFRARIAGLSEFDKVVGGLCWCITSSGADIDVNILFQENSTIGQKIKLSETIVAALRKMNCPHPLQAHQIQGSDFPALHPVIVWLVKKFFENREATFAQLRRYAKLRFAKDYTLPEDLAAEDGGGGVAAITQAFRPVRKYRRHLEGVNDDGDEGGRRLAEDVRVNSCLLEYGESVAKLLGGEEAGEEDLSAGGGGGEKTGSEATLSLFERKLKQAQKEAEKEEEEICKARELQIQELMQQMAKEGDKAGLVSGSEVGRIVGLQSSEISTAAAGYDEYLENARRRLEEGEASAKGTYAQIAAYKRQKENLEKALTSQSREVKAFMEEMEALRARLASINQELGQSRAYKGRILEETAKLTTLEEKSDKKAELAKLKELVLLNESLKSQESQFKASCKQQLTLLKEKLQAAKGTAGAGEEEDDEYMVRMLEIEQLHEKITSKHSKMRQLLAGWNLQIASTSRLIDDVPTRTELIQYERRFAELYDQVDLKLEETRKYYDFYNTLDSTREIMKRQIKLLNSISENFETALKNRSARDEFLRQFEAINRGVEDLYQNKVKSLDQKASKVETLKSNYQSLLDEERKYFKAVKDFQEECQKNDLMTRKLAELQQSS